MKSESATKHKLKQVRFRHLKKRVAAGLKELPENCGHNHEFMHPLTNGTPTGMCICPAQTGERLCDRAWGGIEKAKSCPHFQAKQTKDEIKSEFASALEGMSFAQVAYHFPDMAALMWTLGEETAEADWEGVPDDIDFVDVEIQGVTVRVSPEVAASLEQVEVDVSGKLHDAKHTIDRLTEEAAKPIVVSEPPKPVPWWRRWFGGIQ